MRSHLIASVLVAYFAASSIATKVLGISALSCAAHDGKSSNSTRVIKRPRRKHQTLPSSKHQSLKNHHHNGTISSNTSSVANTSSTSTDLITVVDKKCGANGATVKSSKTSGPNGAIEWLNCGISKSDPSSGWTPPTILMTDLKYKSLDAYVATTFKACNPYISIFNAVAQTTGIPAIFIAAFAMQESSCDPNSSGDNGDAYGLMQITSEKCNGAPNGNCTDPEFNVKTGAEYFASQLKTFKGDVILAIGQYNGWTLGMSYASATAAASGGCCDCQNNLDYIHEFFNGWIQGLNGNDLTFYNNLAACDD